MASRIEGEWRPKTGKRSLVFGYTEKDANGALIQANHPVRVIGGAPTDSVVIRSEGKLHLNHKIRFPDGSEQDTGGSASVDGLVRVRACDLSAQLQFLLDI